MATTDTALRGLVRRRAVWLPTWRGWLLLLLVLTLATAGAILGVYSFLAPQAPLRGGAMVVEGWVNGATLRQAVAEYRAGGYTAIYSTGLPTDTESPMKVYPTFADYGADRLHALGLPNAIAVQVPVAPRDRTYTCGLMLHRWLKANSGVPATLTIVTQGPHARRSRLLFQKAFGNETQIGVIGVASHDYSPAHWWTTSGGFREVMGEIIAYLYARFLFRQVER